MSDTASIVQFPGSEGSRSISITLESVSLNHNGEKLLDDVTAKIPQQGVTGLIGPNGAGKSLLLRTIVGLVAPSSGSVTITNPDSEPALVFQKPVLLRRTVRGNLTHALKVAGVARAKRPGRLAELLVGAQLTRLAENPARTLSGGEQQRLAIARALASDPKMLLLDEPTASLDPSATKSIEDQIKAIANSGVKIVIVTHNRDQAMRLCDDILFLHKGCVLEHTDAHSFLNSPKSDIAKAYFAGELLL